MTTFSYPLNIKRPEPIGDDIVNQAVGRVHGVYFNRLTTTNTGLAAGTTTINLFVAPAGSRFRTCTVDVPTNFDNTTGVQIQVGTATLVSLLADVTVSSANATYRNAYVATQARVSNTAIALTADTTIQAKFTITSTLTAGDIIIWTEVY
jgi:hypothetical protein